MTIKEKFGFDTLIGIYTWICRFLLYSLILSLAVNISHVAMIANTIEDQNYWIMGWATGVSFELGLIATNFGISKIIESKIISNWWLLALLPCAGYLIYLNSYSNYEHAIEAYKISHPNIGQIPEIIQDRAYRLGYGLPAVSIIITIVYSIFNVLRKSEIDQKIAEPEIKKEELKKEKDEEFEKEVKLKKLEISRIKAEAKVSRENERKIAQLVPQSNSDIIDNQDGSFTLPKESVKKKTEV